MTEKMGNTEHKEEDSFALYTEKIVPKPSVKYRRLIRAAKFFAAAVLFGLIASGVMLLVYPALEKKMVQRNTDKEILTIEKDEYPSEEQDNTETKETTADDNYEAVLQTTDAAALKNVATAAIKSLVLIDRYGKYPDGNTECDRNGRTCNRTSQFRIYYFDQCGGCA